MKVIGYVLAACLIIAALRLVMVVMIVALAILVLWWTIRSPRDVLGLGVMLSIIAVVNAYPVAVLGLVAIGLVIWVCKRAGR
ncbi:hypothetical protein SAMN05444678_1269 [Sphingomonas sp. YR710]|uniref:hypothetical protein n=1 Tax=Sphingomonas sp. YR710 TaxID=1882773 RepID=UPI000883FCCA|nr:hypothetical protein [Sphingomonas sp. YR710]SDD84837.1 hypothetical protein SAMN05444678_1269 [Sphingomonas sp. YR710]